MNIWKTESGKNKSRQRYVLAFTLLVAGLLLITMGLAGERVAAGVLGWSKHTVDGDFDSAWCVYATDLDGDYDIDILGAAYYATEDNIMWWENDGSQNFSGHVIDADFSFSRFILAADVDSDGDMDVIASADDTTNEVAWWENNGSESFTKHTIDGNFNGARCIYAADIDGDDDIDILGAGNYANQIAWWENDLDKENDAEDKFTKYTIRSSYTNAKYVYAADIDGDDDIDVLGVAWTDDLITWWENDHNKANDDSSKFTEHTIDEFYDGAECVYAADIDGDDDMDILGAAGNAWDITWWKNDHTKANNDPAKFIKYTINGDYGGAFRVYAADMDGDNDMDVLAAAAGTKYITWWENDGSPAEGGWTQENLDTNFNAAYSIHVADVDQDGWNDVLGAAFYDDDIVWWENLSIGQGPVPPIPEFRSMVFIGIGLIVIGGYFFLNQKPGMRRKNAEPM